MTCLRTGSVRSDVQYSIFRHKNSGQRFCYETPSAIVYYSVCFVNRLSTVYGLFSASTKFLPTFSSLAFYQVSTKILQNTWIFKIAQLCCFGAFYHQKAPWNRDFCVTQCDSVVLSVKLVCLYHKIGKSTRSFLGRQIDKSTEFLWKIW